MFKPTVKPLLAVVVAVGLVTACGLIEPKDSELKPNQSPVVVLTAYPPNVYDHTVTFYWRGQDADGIVLYYDTNVDGAGWVRTQRTDTTIVFSAVDDAVHTFAVRCYDDDGAVSTADQRSFTATSIAPTTLLKAAPPPNARIGPAPTIELDADDPDDQFFTWRYRIDNEPWSEWRADSSFAFGSPSIVAGGLGVLSVGVHTFYGQVRDASGLVAPDSVSISFEVVDGTAPSTSVTLCEINGSASYADYSAFTDLLRDRNIVYFEIAGNASSYFGTLAGFSYIWCKAQDLPTAQFSPWSRTTEVEKRFVLPGQYWFIVKARDNAGNEDASPESLLVDIVDPAADLDPNAILLIQETRNGTGGAGSPTVARVNEEYAAMLEGRTYTTVNYGDLSSRNWYVSPRVAGRYGTILWIDDDSSDHWLFSHGENMRFLREYVDLKRKYLLPQPTRLLLSHWNLLGASNVNMGFVRSIFGVDSLATNANSGNVRDFLGAQGTGDLAGTTLQVDAAKLPNSFQGKLNKVWAFVGPPGYVPLTTWIAAEPDTLAMTGRVNAYFHHGEYCDVVLTGYPLFFMTEARAFMNAALQKFGL